MQYPENALKHRREFLKNYIASGKIKVGKEYPDNKRLYSRLCDGSRAQSQVSASHSHVFGALVQKDQFDASLAYLENIGDQPINWKAFEAEHGVGVEVCFPPQTAVSPACMAPPGPKHMQWLANLHQLPQQHSSLHSGYDAAHAALQVSPEQISAAVAEELSTVRDRLVAERCSVCLGQKAASMAQVIPLGIHAHGKVCFMHRKGEICCYAGIITTQSLCSQRSRRT